MTIGQKILRNKSWLAVAAMLVLLIIFAATGWIQTTWGTWTIAVAFFAAVAYALYYAFGKKKSK